MLSVLCMYVFKSRWSKRSRNSNWSAVEQVWCWYFSYRNLSPWGYVFVLFRSLVSSFSAHINAAFSCSRQQLFWIYMGNLSKQFETTISWRSKRTYGRPQGEAASIVIAWLLFPCAGLALCCEQAEFELFKWWWGSLKSSNAVCHATSHSVLIIVCKFGVDGFAGWATEYVWLAACSGV